MQKVFEKIKVGLEKQEISNRKLAKITKISHTAINKIMNGGYTPDFIVFIKIIQLAYPDDLEKQKESLRSYCEHMSPVNTRIALEFLSMYGDVELLEEVIKKSEILFDEVKKEKKRLSKSLHTNKQLVDLYSLLCKRSTMSISSKEYYVNVKDMLKSCKITSEEVKVISEFALIYSFMDSFDYKVAREYTERLIPYIEQVKNSTLNRLYKFRAQEVLLNCYHRANDTEMTRMILQKIIDDADNHYIGMLAGAYCVLGETYVFSDFTQAKLYMEKALEIIKVPTNKKLKTRKENIKTTLDFLYILHEIDLHLIQPTHPAEQAFLLAKLKRFDEAIGLLEALLAKNGELSAIQHYYLGYTYLKKGDTDISKIHFEESLEKFKKTSDFFYIKLPMEYKN
ncbi:AimR family lysis-lysogeny pheromone receptor [Ectobacillus antri]|uniref:AimR family lysis-lysogeny pheromone receptor n=1 Tax=Ectobacillus antri TaxID=2486280 RepID=UPI000F597088|nr:AimR family lysis-lysogeny pheromone receptor [Ectobacillus antri]